MLKISIRIALVVLLMFSAAKARAAEPSAENEARARAAFEQGLAAARGEHWQEATEAFERAYAATGRPSVLPNLGSARLRAGHLASAAQSFETYLALPPERTTAEIRAQVRQTLDALAPRVPKLTVVVHDARPGDEVTLDGQLLTASQLGRPLPVDPGEHQVELHRGGTVASQRCTATEGGNERVELVVLLAAAPKPSPAAETKGSGGGGFWSSPWLWGSVAAVAAASTAAVIWWPSSADTSYRGNLGAGRMGVP